MKIKRIKTRKKIRIFIKLIKLRNLNSQIKHILPCSQQTTDKWMLLLKTFLYLSERFQLINYKKSQKNLDLTLRHLLFKKIHTTVYFHFLFKNFFSQKMVKDNWLLTRLLHRKKSQL